MIVVGVAVLDRGRLLAARRTSPPGWELPGGKVHEGEDPDAAAVREIAEELGCTVAVTGWLPGTTPISAGYELVACTARLVSGEPVPLEHGAVWWLRPEDLDVVGWLPADVAFIDALRDLHPW